MILRPGQCDIKEISLSSNNKDVVFDRSKGFLNYVQTVDIYESIYTPYIVADVSIVDGSSLKESLNLSGGEEFNIKFLGHGNDQTLSYKLKLSEINGMVTAQNMRSKIVSMRMYSSEYLLNSAKTISKSYSTSTSSIVKEIISNELESEKSVTIDSTKDLPVVVVPYMNPLTALSFIRQRSVPQSDLSSPVLFFENQKGFFFTTVKSIFDNGGSGSSEPLIFFQREGISSNVKGSTGSMTDINSYRLFANYTVKTPVDLANLLDDGGLNCVIADYDFNTKTYRRRLFTNNPNGGSFIDFTDGKNPLLTNQIFNDFSQYVGKSFFVPFAKYKDVENETVNFQYDSLAERYSYTNLLTQQKTYIDIPGNTKVMAGSIVSLEIPRHDSMFDNKEKNEMDSGKYLVSSVRHSISVLLDSKYDTHLELIRYGRGVLT